MTDTKPEDLETVAFSHACDVFVGDSSKYTTNDKHTECERVGKPVPVELGIEAYTSGIAHQGPTCISAPAQDVKTLDGQDTDDIKLRCNLVQVCDPLERLS
jgi:hypothetical protein